MCLAHDWNTKSQDKMETAGFRECLVGKAFPRDTRETFYFTILSFLIHTFSLSHTTLTNKSHLKYRVYKIKQNYNKIWHEIKANKNIVVNYNFTHMKQSKEKMR